jgi:competence protein ComEC
VVRGPEQDEGDFDPRAVRVRPIGLPRFPLLPIASALVVGILLHERVPAWPIGFVGVAAVSGLTALFTPAVWVRSVAVLFAFTCLGIGVAQRAHYVYPVGHVAHLTTDTRRLAEMELVLDETPRLLRTSDVGRARPPRVATLASVTAVRTWEGWAPASGRILFRINEPDPRLRAGQRLRVLGWLERPGEAMNPGQFDFANFYRGRRVVAGLSATDHAGIRILGSDTPTLLSRLRASAADQLARGFEADRVDDAALLKAMLLGVRDPAMHDAREAFRASGTSHYLAVSGLHVGIVAGVVLVMCRTFGTGPRVTLSITGLTVTLYACLAAPSPPVLRATILALSYGVGALIGRRGSGLQLLSAAAVVLLLIAPLDLYRAGFQLSFVTVLGLIVFGERVRRWLGAGQTDPLRGVLDARPVRLARAADRRMLAAVATGLVAWLASMPLVAVHFGQFNTWAVPASLAVAPLVVASLVGGVLKLVLTTCFPEAAGTWATLSGWPVSGMTEVVDWFAGLPGADVPLPVPALWLVLLFYGSVALAVWAGPVRRRTRMSAGAKWAARVPLVATTVLVFVLPSTAGSRGQADELRVILLAVGQGQCAVIESATGVTLIDAGSMSLGRPVEACIAPFLRHRGHDRVERIVLSHANFDHYNATDVLARMYGAGDIAVGPAFLENAGNQPAGRRLLRELDRLDRPPRPLRLGDVLPLGGRTRLRVLWPPDDDLDRTPNDASCVLRLEHGSSRILFTGDIQSEAMSNLLRLNDADGGDLLRADVLVAPHHGSAEPETAAFLEAVSPTTIISSNGRRLSRKQLDFDALADAAGMTLIRTHSAGAINVALDIDGTIAVSTHLGTGRRTLLYPE